jgi:hypothetical protein
MAPTTANVHRLKVTLRRVRPPVWRRIEVRSTTNLHQLSAELETAMGCRPGQLGAPRGVLIPPSPHHRARYLSWSQAWMAFRASPGNHRVHAERNGSLVLIDANSRVHLPGSP